MRINSIPGLGRLLATLPPTERSVRLIFRSLGHGPSLDDGRITRADLDCYLALLRDTGTLRNELALGRVVVSPLRGLDPRLLPDSVLHSVRTPTLFVWGANDPFGGTATARTVVSRLPNAELDVMPGAGHAPWLDDLHHCAAATSHFLGSAGVEADLPAR
jgi:pimeloyl-ACP methyl ester carboxylesterase